MRRSGACPSSCSSTRCGCSGRSHVHRSGRRVRQRVLRHPRRPVCRESIRLRPSGRGPAGCSSARGRRRRRSIPIRGPSRPVAEPEHDCFDLQPAGPPYHALAQRPGIALWSLSAEVCDDASNLQRNTMPLSSDKFGRRVGAQGERQRESGSSGRSLRPPALRRSSCARTLIEASPSARPLANRWATTRCASLAICETRLDGAARPCFRATTRMLALPRQA